MTTTITLSTEDYQALLSEQQRLANQLRLVTVERDLLKERVKQAFAKIATPRYFYNQYGRENILVNLNALSV